MMPILYTARQSAIPPDGGNARLPRTCSTASVVTTSRSTEDVRPLRSVLASVIFEFIERVVLRSGRASD
jgi:hypothetical protein